MASSAKLPLALMVLVTLAAGCVGEQGATGGRDVPVIVYDDDDVAAAVAAMERGETPPESLGLSDDDAAPTDATEDDDADEDADTDGDIVWLQVVDAPLGLNVRTGPGTEHGVLVQIETGTVVSGTGLVDEATGWVQLTIGDEVGWVTPGYVQETAKPAANTAYGPTPTPLPTPTPIASKQLEVTDAPLGLNLRSGPSTTYPVVSEIDDGAIVEATGRVRTVDDEEWLEIVHQGLTGWVYAAFLEPAA